MLSSQKQTHRHRQDTHNTHMYIHHIYRRIKKLMTPVKTPKELRIDALFTEADANEDGVINAEEAKAVISKLSPGTHMRTHKYTHTQIQKKKKKKKAE